MKSKIPEALWKITGGEKTWKHYGVTNGDRDIGWHKYAEVKLDQLTEGRLKRLAEMIEPHSKIRGAAMLLKDIRAWIKITKGERGSAKPRTVEQFSTMLKAYLATVPGHRVYKRGEHSDAMFAYYAASVSFTPESSNGRGDYRPPMVFLTLFWMELGVRMSKQFTFYAEDCLGMTVVESLTKMKLLPETPEYRQEHLEDLARWEDLFGKVGLQLRGTGVGTDNLDGNGDGSRWSSFHMNKIRLDHNGEPAHLVVDVVAESDKIERDTNTHLDIFFWQRNAIVVTGASDEACDPSNEDLNDEVDEDDDALDDTGRLPDEDKFERPEPEIPVHPVLPTFDLRRHMRMRVHVRNVEVYQHDTHLAEKLVLPKDTTDLVEMLIAQNGMFRDIVAGKSGGTIILCAGPAGVGKTLTAEVYAESMSRPLYSVQCSQLGVKPEELETELFRIFARSQRWNAILLLDEADVYVMARGDNLQQNAIVGVFLRVLEYYSGVLFMTTNRSDRVDDAITSRCVARIDYELPSKDDQRRIWRVLCETSGTAISDEVIEAVVAKYDLSGRDVKNLVKLAGMVSASRGTPITVDTIDFVKRFKPTVDAKPH